MGFGKDKTGVILRQKLQEIPLGTLAADTALTLGTYSLEEDFRLLKAEIDIYLKGMAQDEGVVIGLADAELTTAEIKEALEASPIDRNDYRAKEQCTRPVWVFGILDDSNQNQWKIEWKKRWTFKADDGFELFAYNPFSGALTTGGLVTVIATYYGLWLD